MKYCLILEPDDFKGSVLVNDFGPPPIKFVHNFKRCLGDLKKTFNVCSQYYRLGWDYF